MSQKEWVTVYTIIGLLVEFSQFVKSCTSLEGRLLSGPHTKSFEHCFHLLRHFRERPIHQSHISNKFGKAGKLKRKRKSTNTWEVHHLVRKAVTFKHLHNRGLRTWLWVPINTFPCNHNPISPLLISPAKMNTLTAEHWPQQNWNKGGKQKT